MVKNHLSRLAAPKSWFMKRKSQKYIARPLPGPHTLNRCFTLNFLLREILDYAKTTKEIRTILHKGDVLVDGVARKEHKFPIGLMDVIVIPKLNENYRIIYNDKGKFVLLPIKKTEVNSKLLRIIRKSIVKKGKMQLTFHDGRTLLVDKFKGRVGDSVLFDFSKKSISKHLSLDKGALVYLSGGSHIGRLAKVKDVIRLADLEKPKVVVELEGKEYITPARYVFVVGKDKPELSLEVKK